VEAGSDLGRGHWVAQLLCHVFLFWVNCDGVLVLYSTSTCGVCVCQGEVACLVNNQPELQQHVRLLPGNQLATSHHGQKLQVTYDYHVATSLQLPSISLVPGGHGTTGTTLQHQRSHELPTVGAA